MNGFGWNESGFGNVQFPHLNAANVPPGWGVIPTASFAGGGQPPHPYPPPPGINACFVPQQAAWTPGAPAQHQFVTHWHQPPALPSHAVPLSTHAPAVGAAIHQPPHPPVPAQPVENHQLLTTAAAAHAPPQPPQFPPPAAPPPPPPSAHHSFLHQEPPVLAPATGTSTVNQTGAEYDQVPTIPLRTPLSPNSLRQKEEITQLKSDDETFENRFSAWEEEFNRWKSDNADSMDSAKYSYEREMIQMREKLLSRRYALRCRLEEKVALFEKRAPRTITPPPHLSAADGARITGVRDADDERRWRERSASRRSPQSDWRRESGRSRSPGHRRLLPGREASYRSDGFHGDNYRLDYDHRDDHAPPPPFMGSDRGVGSLSEAIDNVVDAFSRRDSDRYESRDRWSRTCRRSPPPVTDPTRSDSSWRDSGNRSDNDYRKRFSSPPGRRRFDERRGRSRSPRRLMSPPLRRSPPRLARGRGATSPPRQNRYDRRRSSRSPPFLRRRFSRSPPSHQSASLRRRRSRSRSPLSAQRPTRYRDTRSPPESSRVPSLMQRGRDRSPPSRPFNTGGDARHRSPVCRSSRQSAAPGRPGPRPITPSVDIADLIRAPGRDTRPPNLVIILRGLPGSGKTHLAKLIKDEEIGNKAGAPRILSLDDYFYVEREQKKSVSSTTSAAVKCMEYEYDEAMEPSYRSALEKAFRKTVDDGLFHFIILDCVNNRVKHFDSMAHYAVSHGFKVYVAELDTDVATCHQRNVHGRTMSAIKHMHQREWESTPARYPLLDLKALLQDTSIQEVEMEDVVSSTENDTADNVEQVPVSKWEQMDHSEEKLDKLDGVMSARRRLDVHHTPQTMEDYLQLPDDYQQRQQLSVSAGGRNKKRVRWADIEERLDQQKARDIGFVVGQTDWSKMTGPDRAIDALEQTKYI